MNGVMMTHVSIDPPHSSRRTRRAAAAAVTLAAAGAITFGSAAAAHAQTYYGCPEGAVCLYPAGKNYTNSTPELMLWSYGPHNLSNVYGYRDIINNQSDGASANLCLGYDGTNCNDPGAANNGYIPAQTVMINTDFGPVNSIVLDRP